jgi:hypothetical protein
MKIHELRQATTRAAKTYWPYGLMTLLVMLPLLTPGFILTLDLVFTPSLTLPDNTTSSYPFRALLYGLSSFVPSEIIEKVILLNILLLAGIGMHRLIHYVEPRQRGIGWGVYIASIFFMINPFTYSRFMAGQYAVLLGYALLPWFARLLVEFGRLPALKTALKLGGLAAIIGIVSIHTVGELVLLLIASLAIALWRHRRHLKAYLRYGSIAAAVFLLASSYWLVPLALGKGPTAQLIGQFTSADATVFATTGENPLAKLGNIVRLQGFWTEERDLYLLPQDRMVLWGFMALVIIGLVIWGGIILWRKQRALFVLFTASGLAAMLLAAGAMEPLAQHISLLSGYREPHKLVGLVALAYSVFLAFGIHAALAKARRRSETGYAIATVAFLMLPLLLTRTMLWGFDGQLKPRHYPADWFSINQRLEQDDSNSAVLFLPWHQYMSFRFAGRIIANPAPAFFSKPTIVSADPELDGAVGSKSSPQQEAVQHILSAKRQNFSEQLAAQNIKYIILAKELDYRKYTYLDSQSDLKPIKEYQTATLYLNQSWRK